MRACFLILTLAAAGCATYSYTFQPVDRALAARQYDVALTEFEQRFAPGGVDTVLYHLNHGMLLRLAGRYRDSNEALERAKVAIERVEALSVTEQATAVMIGDATRSYEGEIFEKVLLHIYKALNYLALDEPYDARVEALQVDVKLRELVSRGRETVYTEEAFARYLSGILFESLGEWSDAMIAYRKALDAYRVFQTKYGVPVPRSLQAALVRMSDHLGIEDERRKYAEEFAITEWMSVADRQERGELVVTLNTGRVAAKGEQGSQAFDPQSGRMIRISLPYYRARQNLVTGARLIVDDRQVPLELVEDIDAVAIKSLQSHLASITVRQIARAAVKYRAAKEAERRDPALGLVMNVAGVVTEQADTRSWSTLPSRLYLGRAVLPPGDHAAKLELLDAFGRVVHVHDLGTVTILQSRTEYLEAHWTAN
jgi:hypothetical protein